MRRVAIAISAAVLIASTLMLTGGGLSLHSSSVAAQDTAPSQVGSWLVTLTDQSGSQTTPVLMTFAADGTLVAGELPVPAGALLPGPSAAPSESPSPTEPLPSPTELPASPSGLLNSAGQGIWNAVGESGLVFTYVVLQSDQAGAFVQKVTVSGTATVDDSGSTITGDYTMRFAAPDGSDLGSSSGTLDGDRIQLAMIASFDASQVAGTLDVKFTDKSTGNPTNWNWDFGDGSLAADQDTTHTYAQPGDYTVTLTVSNDEDQTDTTSQTISVGEVTSPSADFDTIQTPGSLEIKFRDTSTGGPNAWSWNFGDGKTSTRQSPRHTYAKAGNYKVKLTVSNDGGSNSTTKTVAVLSPPTASFTITQTAGSLLVKFTDTSKGNPTAWSWDFGDGRSSPKTNPGHTYDKSGTYKVKLSVTNDAGSDSTTVSVTVPPPAPPSHSPSPSGG